MCSLSLLYVIPWYGYVKFWKTFTVDGCLDCFQFGAIVNGVAYGSSYLSFGEHRYPFLLGTYLGMDSIAHKVCLSSVLADTAQ